MTRLKKGDNKKHQRLRKQSERKHQVTKDCFGFRGLCMVQNPRRLLALPGPVVGNEAVKLDGGQHTEDFESAEEVV